MQIDELKDINHFFRTCNAKTPRAFSIALHWKPWFDNLNWFQKTSDPKVLREAIARKKSFNDANNPGPMLVEIGGDADFGAAKATKATVAKPSAKIVAPKTIAKPVAKPVPIVAKPAPKPAPKPVAKPVTKPAVSKPVPAPKPAVSKPAPAPKPAPKPPAKPVSKPAKPAPIPKPAKQPKPAKPTAAPKPAMAPKPTVNPFYAVARNIRSKFTNASVSPTKTSAAVQTTERSSKHRSNDSSEKPSDEIQETETDSEGKPVSHVPTKTKVVAFSVFGAVLAAGLGATAIRSHKTAGNRS